MISVLWNGRDEPARAACSGYRRAFTLAEMLISMAASVVVLGALLLSSVSLQRALHGSEVYAGSYSDQRRLIDYVSRDLRRGIGLAATDAAGSEFPMGESSVEIADRSTLVITLPGYYQSEAPNSAAYDEPSAIIADGNLPGYGTERGAAAPVRVVFRKVYLSSQKTVCFVREEAGTPLIIVRDAKDLHVQVSIENEGRTALIKAWFRAPYSGAAPLVSTYDEVMLRNLRRDLPP